MRLSFEEPTGVWVQQGSETAALHTFPEFVAAVERGAVSADALVWSHIVTAGRWVRAGDMRLFRMLMGMPPAVPADDKRVWPPPIPKTW